MMRILGYLLLMIFSFKVVADDLTIVAVGEAEKESDRIIFTYDTSVKKDGMSAIKIMQNDFGFYKNKFKVLPFDLKNSEQLQFTRYKVEIRQRVIGSDSILDLKFSDERTTEGKVESFAKSFTLNKKHLRNSAHTISDTIYKQITGADSIFLSKIIFVSDRASTRKQKIKELYRMDFDGMNIRRLTYHRGFVISPAVNREGTKILYSLISEKKRYRKRNINLRMLDLVTKSDTLISSRRGINSGAVFLKDDSKILLTLSTVGNAEIFEMDLKSKKLRRITKNYSEDVDPSIRDDGQRMAFLSGRSGKGAMIYTLDPSGTEKSVRRISYVGKFNATPRFSPNGTEIAFSSWVDNRFDIYRIGVDGDNLSRLTKDFGSNEDPTYSPDGEFIAFSSQRVFSRKRVIQDIYIMDREGAILGAITSKFGNCITPRWSN